MASMEALPEGWVVWNEEPEGRLILAYRPDVFDGGAFPSACLPTISVAPGGSPDHPLERRERSDDWYVALYLEPDVRAREVDASFGTRDGAIGAAVDAAQRFVRGGIDYRGAYQVPRPDYLRKLDDLVGGG